MTAITPEPGRRTLPPLLASALETGPFHRALHIAIDDSGLTLARLEYHLSQRGFRVGRSTLSYWQQGRRQPERPASMRALEALESILEVPPKSLSNLLGPPKPRGRWLNHNAGGVSWAEIFDEEAVTRLVAMDNRRATEKLQDISVVETFGVGKDRRIHWLEVHKLTTARVDGADRNMFVYYADPDVDVTRIKLTNLANCRIGRRQVLPEAYFVAFEIIFDKTLRARETHVFSYTMDISDAFLTPEQLAGSGADLAEANEGPARLRPLDAQLCARGALRPVHDSGSVLPRGSTVDGCHREGGR